jgi:hypothetical protein
MPFTVEQLKDSKIAMAIATALQAKLTTGERASLTTVPTQNAAAYDLIPAGARVPTPSSP